MCQGNQGGVMEWVARSDVFPDGLDFVRNATGWPIQGHNRFSHNSFDSSLMISTQVLGHKQYLCDTKRRYSSFLVYLNVTFVGQWDFAIDTQTSSGEVVAVPLEFDKT